MDYLYIYRPGPDERENGHDLVGFQYFRHSKSKVSG